MEFNLDVLLNTLGKQWENETPEIKNLWKDRDEYIVQGISYYLANNRLPKPGFKPENIKQDSAVPKGTN